MPAPPLRVLLVTDGLAPIDPVEAALARWRDQVRVQRASLPAAVTWSQPRPDLVLLAAEAVAGHLGTWVELLTALPGLGHAPVVVLMPTDDPQAVEEAYASHASFCAVGGPGDALADFVRAFVAFWGGSFTRV